MKEKEKNGSDGFDNGHMSDEEMKVKSRVEFTDGRATNRGRPMLGFEKSPVTLNLPKNLKRRFDILMIKNDITTRWKMLELLITDWDLHHDNQSSLK